MLALAPATPEFRSLMHFEGESCGHRAIYVLPYCTNPFQCLGTPPPQTHGGVLVASIFYYFEIVAALRGIILRILLHPMPLCLGGWPCIVFAFGSGCGWGLPWPYLLLDGFIFSALFFDFSRGRGLPWPRICLLAFRRHWWFGSGTAPRRLYIGGSAACPASGLSSRSTKLLGFC